MIYFKRKLIIIIALLLFLTAGAFVYKSFYDNKTPKSAKLVFIQEYKSSAIG